jgi:hypothetical protein
MVQELQLADDDATLRVRLRSIELAQGQPAGAVDYGALDEVLNAVLDAFFLGTISYREADALTREARLAETRRSGRIRRFDRDR